jgi:glycosyltransferase involved in cell wall biosynthesis
MKQGVSRILNMDIAISTDSNKIKLAAITDSPKISTGFGNVAKMLLYGFHDSGLFDVCSFGTMDFEYDFHKQLPFQFQPANPFDENGIKSSALFLANVQPDVIFILFDPGSADTFINIILAMFENGNIKRCPVILYTPIEGVPIPGSTASTFAKVIETQGKVVLYSPGSVQLVYHQFPDFIGELTWAHHGLDHAPFRKYNSNYREYLRKGVGWDDQFVVGSVGVNKRTKGFDNIIYTARVLRDIGSDENIKFYLHTDPTDPTMWGYNLKDMAANWGVEDMMIYREKITGDSRGGNVKGIGRITEDMHYAADNSPEEQRTMLDSLGFIDRLNMLDCYLDLSQVEGWGLPAHEAMKCGVPTISINDNAIRQEIYRDGAIMLDPEPFRMWSTWHTGTKLIAVDPAKAAEAIVELKTSDDKIKKFWSDLAINNASRFVWKPTQDKMIEIAKGVVENYVPK